MTAALEWGEWSVAHPVCTLPPGKTRYPFYRRLGGPQCWSGRAENLVPNGIRSWTVQPIVSHYTNEILGPHWNIVPYKNVTNGNYSTLLNSVLRIAVLWHTQQSAHQCVPYCCTVTSYSRVLCSVLHIAVLWHHTAECSAVCYILQYCDIIQQSAMKSNEEFIDVRCVKWQNSLQMWSSSGCVLCLKTF